MSPNGSGLIGSGVTVNLTLKGEHASAVYGKRGLHLWYKPGNKQTYKMTEISADIDIDNASATGTMKNSNDSAGENLDVETKPRHFILPGMVYIGVKLK